jgi:hypothetical protein
MSAREEPQTVATGGFRPARLALTALLVGAVALVAVGLALVAVEVRDVASYPVLVGEISLARLALGPLVVLAGVAIAAAAGFLIGSLAVSASFAVAGPLYRLARNAEVQRDDPGAPLVPLRGGDLLQDEAGRLVAALVAVEALLVVLGLIALQGPLLEHLDARLYRIHYLAEAQVLGVLRSDLLWTAAGAVVGTLAALLVARWGWARAVERTLAEWRVLVRRTRDLDFGPDPVSPRPHPALARILEWRAAERQRLRDVEALVESLAREDAARRR